MWITNLPLYIEMDIGIQDIYCSTNTGTIGIGTSFGTNAFVNVATVNTPQLYVDQLRMNHSQIGIGTSIPSYDVHSMKDSYIYNTYTSNIQSTSSVNNTSKILTTITTLTASNVQFPTSSLSPFNIYTLAEDGLIPSGTTNTVLMYELPAPITLYGSRWLLTVSFDAYRPTAGLSTYSVRVGRQLNSTIWDVGMDYSFFFNTANVKHHITMRRIIIPSAFTAGYDYPYIIRYIDVACTTNTAFDTTCKLNASVIDLCDSIA